MVAISCSSKNNQKRGHYMNIANLDICECTWQVLEISVIGLDTSSGIQY